MPSFFVNAFADVLYRIRNYTKHPHMNKKLCYEQPITVRVTYSISRIRGNTPQITMNFQCIKALPFFETRRLNTEMLPTESTVALEENCNIPP